MPDSDEMSAPLREFLRRDADRTIPFWAAIGMDILAARRGWAQVRVRFSEALLNSNGVLHGGVLFSAADAATAVALLGLLADGERTATTEMKINFLKPVRGGDVVAEAAIVHKGGHTAVGEVSVRDADGALVAKALATYAVSGSRGRKKELRT